MAIAALILGILSLVNCWYGGGIVFGIVGLILGGKALQADPEEKKAKIGKTLSMIGLIVSVVGLVACIIISVVGGVAAANY